MSRKQLVIGLLLLATLIAVWLAPAASDDGVALSARTESRIASGLKPASLGAGEAAKRGGLSQLEVLRIRPRDVEVAGEDDPALFASTRWGAAAKAPVVAAAPIEAVAPPPPQAPPLPFRVIGRYDEAGSAAIFLQLNDQNLVVRVGDTIGEQYKVESLEGNTLTLRYLPLNQSQALDVGGAS